MFGHGVIQSAIEFLEGPGNAEQLALAHELRGEVLRLVSNQNGIAMVVLMGLGVRKI